MQPIQLSPLRKPLLTVPLLPGSQQLCKVIGVKNSMAPAPITIYFA